MAVVWKFKLPWPFIVEEEVLIQMPDGAKILTLQMQDRDACIWAMVTPSNPLVNRFFTLHKTGFPCSGQYIGTIQMAPEALVFHLFERG